MTRSALLKRATLVALLAVLVSTLDNPPTGQTQSEHVYLALGDSLPAGLLASLPDERGFPGLLQDLMETERLASDDPGNVELINLAEPGETVQTFWDDGQLAEALDVIDSIPQDSLQTVSLTIGGNNILSLWESTADEREDELEQFRTDFAAIVDELANVLEEHNTNVFVTTYYDLTEGDPSVEGSNAWWLRQFNEVIAETARAAEFTVVDLESQFRNRVGELTWFPADFHPNNAGHQLIARAIWEELGYDQSPPEIEITRPTQGEVRNRVPTIYVSATDNVGIDSVVLRVEDEDQFELIYVRDRSAWIGLWDARDFAGHEAELTVVATDVSGNEASDSVSITLPSR
jgi:lysophospholipase L1-like esterase